MTEIDNDKLLKDFFAENKREIADNGFSRRCIRNGSRSHALRHPGRTGSRMGNTERCTHRHDQPRRNQPRSEINHHCNGRPTVHGRTESSINGITMLVTLCAKGLAQL